LIGTVVAVCIVRRHCWSIVTLRHLSTAEVGVVWAMVVAALGQASLWCSRRSIRFWGAHDDAVICVSLDMFLQILRSLECLPAEFTLVRLQWDVDSNVGGDVVPLDRGGSALAPRAGQVQVVSRLSSDMSLTYVLLMTMVSTGGLESMLGTYVKSLWGLASLTATLPLALQVLACGIDLRLLRTRCSGSL